jgi:perosamine synthetase
MWKIPLFKIFWDVEDVENVEREIKSGMNWAVGPNVEKFEKMIAEYIGTGYAAVFNSGTSALHSILLAYGLGKGDEVIVPSFTFIATANSPMFVGAKPVFADIEEETLGLDPESVKKNITNKTKAILPIHYGGCPCKIKELREMANDNDIILIEDAAEAMGASIENEKVGTFGDSAVLSFCQNKIITTGEGGAVVTDSRDIYEKLKLLRSHGRLETGDYFSSAGLFDYKDLGYNFRMSNITAALGISQIKKVDMIINMRQKNSGYLTERILEETDKIKPISPPKGYNHVHQLYTVIAEDRDKLISYLNDKNITTKIYFDPVHLSYFYREKLGYNCVLPVTEEMARRTITLPMYPSLSRDEMDIMAKTIGKFYR